MLNQNIKIIVIILSGLFVFFFRWTIIENFTFWFSRFSRYKQVETYSSDSLGFSVKYDKRLAKYINEDENSVSFGDPPLLRVTLLENNTLFNAYWQVFGKITKYIRISSKELTYNPLSGCIGAGFTVVNNKLVLFFSHPKIAGNSGRGISLFFSAKNRVYQISTMYESTPITNIIELNKLLSGFKVLDE